MKYLRSPLFWLLFGVVGYPLLCLATSALATSADLELHWLPLFAYTGQRQPEYNLLWFGAPLGLVSALSAIFWEEALNYAVARWTAALGGVSICAFALYFFGSTPSRGWINDYCYFVPLVVWAGGLLLFGCLARPPAK